MTLSLRRPLSLLVLSALIAACPAPEDSRRDAGCCDLPTGGGSGGGFGGGAGGGGGGNAGLDGGGEEDAGAQPEDAGLRVHPIEVDMMGLEDVQALSDDGRFAVGRRQDFYFQWQLQLADTSQKSFSEDPLTQVGGGPLSISATASGAVIALVQGTSSGAYVITYRDGGVTYEAPDGGHYPQDVDISSDGAVLAWTEKNTSNQRFVIIKRAGQTPVDLRTLVPAADPQNTANLTAVMGGRALTDDGTMLLVRQQVTLSGEYDPLFLVNLSDGGVQTAFEMLGGNFPYAVSGNGRTILYDSYAQNRPSLVYVREQGADGGVDELVSVASDGTPANDQSYAAGISGDGRFVLFRSAATNLVTGDTNDMVDLFLHDRQSGMTLRMVDAEGHEFRLSGLGSGVISRNGDYVLYSGSSGIWWLAPNPWRSP